jgi:diguanylate cyclase (GGDEF)-like protein
MDAARDIEQLFGDYGRLFAALCSRVTGFECLGPEGESLWREFPDRHGPVLKIRLRGDKEQTLGSLRLALAEGAALSPEEAGSLLAPAICTLQRELALRLRLVDSYRKLGVQAAEEHLLHQVERAAQGPPDARAMLERILGLCRQHLGVHTAAVLLPDKGIELVAGERLSRDDVQRLAARGAEAGKDLEVVAVGPADRAPLGHLLLAGFVDGAFSPRRRQRVARYLASQIEAVLDRAYDGLTGLMAWPAFEKLLVAVAGAAPDTSLVMFLDVDRLQVVNDTLGRDVGDQVLASFAGILREELTGHQVTRVASDSFAALLMDTSPEAARLAAEAIASRFRGLEFGRGDRLYRASVSIGIGPLTGQEGDGSPLAAAQVACDAAKDRGRGRVEMYQATDQSICQRLDDIQLVGYIRNSIDRGRLALMAQPIRTARAGAEPTERQYSEVLVRLLDDDDSHISPADFLSAAERYQLMEELDRWVVANTFRALSGHAAELRASRARFAINLSGQSLGSESFLPFVQEQLDASGLPPELVCFEITETVAVANLQRAQTFMHALKRRGCRFSLDDFGTGLSSFAYLKLFPVDTLKIDGSFIRDLDTNVVSQSVVAAIAEVARVMQLETVAEFVESEAVLDLLRRLGITWVQGYLLGEPVPLAARISAGSLPVATARTERGQHGA